MLTGEKPYVGETTQAILDQHCEAPIPTLPAPLAALQPLLERLLAKDRAHRLANARELIEEIEEARAAVAPVAAIPKSALSG